MSCQYTLPVALFFYKKHSLCRGLIRVGGFFSLLYKFVALRCSQRAFRIAQCQGGSLKKRACLWSLTFYLIFSGSILVYPGMGKAANTWGVSVGLDLWTDGSPQNLCRRVADISFVGWPLTVEYVHVQPIFLQSDVRCAVRYPNNPGMVYLYFHLLPVSGSCPKGEELNAVTGMCEPNKPAEDGVNAPSTCAFNPINVSTGDKIQVESDFSGKVSFLRYYSSKNGLWKHEYSHKLIPLADVVWVRQPNGDDIKFDLLENADSAVNNFGELIKNDSGYIFKSTDGDLQVYDALGNLLGITNGSGLNVSVGHSNNGDIRVIWGGGLYIDVKQDSFGQPLRTEDSYGRLVEYTYSQENILLKVTKSNLGQFSTRLYVYEDTSFPRALTGIIDENGSRFATWTYDSEGRAISSEHAGGVDKGIVQYLGDSVRLESSLGKATVFKFKSTQGARRLVSISGEPSPNCPSSNSTFTYDDQGLLKTKTDNKGIVTTYDYNERGLEVSRTEASGTAQARTVTTEWHPSLYLPLAVTEPDRVTRYQYDDQGRQLSRTIENR